ncbi:MAG: Hsp20/alpha crystallin family protein [bacterium]|nr:Hsp20/alpha crystallin family protein [bacterium]
MTHSPLRVLSAQNNDESGGSFRLEYIRIEQGSRPLPWSEPTQWVPAIDVVGTEDAVVLEIHLPGIQPDDTQLEITSDQVRISGVRRDIDVTGRSEFYHVEIARGHFLRVISLPKGVDVRQANITFELGVLKLVIPWNGQQWAASCPRARFPEEWS